MKKIKFVNEPGYTYDLFFVFMYYFNRENNLKQFTNCNKAEDDTEYFERMLEEFQPISDDLFLFFYLKEKNISFMTENYFDPYEFAKGYDLSVVLNALSNYEQVIDNVIRFYFNVEEEEVVKCRESLTEINKRIKESKYNSDIKSALYAFFIEPVPYIQKLMQELMVKEVTMKQQYEKNYKWMLQLRDTFDEELLESEFEKDGRRLLDLDSYDTLYVSFCLNHKNLILWQLYDGAAMIVLGADYIDAIQSCIAMREMYELDTFGTAVSEKNRVEILNLMHEKNEITIRDIEQELGFTGTNAYYHLSLMIKAGMLKTRNQGRTILYSINKEYIESLCEGLKRYIK